MRQGEMVVDAVISESVSDEFPCFTGKIQGILQFIEVRTKRSGSSPAKTLIVFILFPIFITGNYFG
jgi:hypothetical protein